MSDAGHRDAHRVRQLVGRRELAAVRPDADEIGIAEVADGGRAIRLATRPQVAAGEATEHRRTSGVRALALQRVEDLFDGVHHV